MVVADLGSYSFYILSKMILIPQQFFGAGDAIFIQSLLKQLCEPGDRIIYPILGHQVEGFSRAYPDVTFIDYKLMNIDFEKRTEVKTPYYRILPIRFADQILNLPYTQCMSAKYQLYGLDWHSWRHVMYERSKMREETLKEIMLNKIHAQAMQLGQEEYQYNLISPYFGSGSQYHLDIEPDNGLPNVVMSSIPGYSLFDWSLLIENATNIYAASSSILYLLELLTLKAQEIHLFARKPIEPHFLNVNYLFTKPYILHE